MASSTVPSKVIASSLGLACFAASIIAGLAVDNPADAVLTNALLSMLVGMFVGVGIGAALEHAIMQRATPKPLPVTNNQPGTTSGPATPAKVSTS